jgi:hypothetical protein
LLITSVITLFEEELLAPVVVVGLAVPFLPLAALVAVVLLVVPVTLGRTTIFGPG